MSKAKRSRLTAPELEPKYRPNIFPAAWPVVKGWDELGWDRHAHQSNSSQALAVDVFGTIRESQSRDRVISALAEELGLPPNGPWTVELEANDPLNELHEQQPTPMDAILRSPEVLLFIECKFREQDGGRCQQPRLRPAKCNGHYEIQTNTWNNGTARCALSVNGARYWEMIPEVLNLRSDVDYHPCPFAGPWYQWMRIVTICATVARRHKLQAAVAVVYADRKGLSMAGKDWSLFRAALRGDAVSFHTITFQRVLELARQAMPLDPDWLELTTWVERKIAAA